MKSMLFVYGTLKRGEGNHYHLEKAVFIGEDSIQGVLFDLGPFPAAVDLLSVPPHIRSRATGRINGEVYEVTNEIITRLDRLEGHPTFYRRDVVDGKLTYLMPWKGLEHRQVRLMPDGSWSSRGRNRGVTIYAD